MIVTIPSFFYTPRTFSVPVIVVFTKIDRLEFREQKRLQKHYIKTGMDLKAALAQAKTECVAAASAEFEKSCVMVLKSDLLPPAWMHYCPVSNKRIFAPLLVNDEVLTRSNTLLDPESIIKLIELTKSTLAESEALNILWASAQMVSCSKIDTLPSIVFLHKIDV